MAFDAAEGAVADHVAARALDLFVGDREGRHGGYWHGIGSLQRGLQIADVAGAELGHARKHVRPVLGAIGEDVLQISSRQLTADAI